MHIPYDKIVQKGEDLTMKSDIVSKFSLTVNNFLKTGTHLCPEMNSEFINPPRDIPVS